MTEAETKRETLSDSSAQTILLAVTGTAPAILTETIWALAHENPPVIPDRVIVLTTTVGRDEIVRELLSPSPDFGGSRAWDVLRATLKKEGIETSRKLRFGKTGDDLRTFTILDTNTGRSGEIDDIRTLDQNTAMADFILEEVRRIVENPDTRLIASIAGGRKTMGALLYACMTLIGRQTDRLTHVLVNEPFEDSRLKPKFFFPGQPSTKLTTVDRQTVDIGEARIDLCNVLFVPLRNLFSEELGRMPGSFSGIVAHLQRGILDMTSVQTVFTASRSHREINVDGVRVRLSPKEHLIALFLADRARSSEPAFGAYKDAVDLINEYRKHLIQAASGNGWGDWRNADGLKAEFDDREVTKALSGIRTKLLKHGLPKLKCRFLPEAARLSFDLRPSNIRIDD